MEKKKAKTTKKTSAKSKYLMQMTSRGVFLGFCLIVLISGWMFVLGVLVGRGTAPVHFDIEVLQKELKALKASIIKQQQERERVEIPTFNKEKELDFYEALKGSQKDEKLTVKKKAANKTAAYSGEKRVEDGATQKTQLVSMKKQTKTKTNTKTISDASPRGAYAVQVASTKDAAAADQVVKKLNSQGHRAYKIKADVPGKGTWYRVRVGGFNSSAAADKAKGNLAMLGYKGMVVKN